jgi:N-hydroxyarylamine O-acetyltransferase
MGQRKRLPLWASQYLQRLGLEERPAIYAYLAELCRAHLQTMPYESVSKLLWFHERKRNSSAIPSVETFVENALHLDCGGTCYTSNSSLQLLLQALGFTSHLVALEPDHMGIIVEVSEWNGEKVYVDVGAASRFSTTPCSFAEKKAVNSKDNCRHWKTWSRLSQQSSDFPVCR